MRIPGTAQRRHRGTAIWLLTALSRPHGAVLGRSPEPAGYHDIEDYPDAETVPGFLLFHFEGDVVLFNIDYPRDRIHREITRATQPVEWVVIDASPINVMDFTGLRKLDELREELARYGIALRFCHVKKSLAHLFNPE